MPDRVRVLIVDDDPAVRDVLSEGLDSSGYVCDTASDGAEALKKIEDAVIDWNNRTHMPEAYSDEVYEAAKDCDFWKYRGHGMNQLTGRANYYTHAKEALESVIGEKVFQYYTKPKYPEDVTPPNLDPKIYPGVTQKAWDKMTESKRWDHIPEKTRWNYMSDKQKARWYGDYDNVSTQEIEDLFQRPEVYYAAYRSFLKRALEGYLKSRGRTSKDVMFQNESDVDTYGQRVNDGDYHLLYKERVMKVFELISKIGVYELT